MSCVEGAQPIQDSDYVMCPPTEVTEDDCTNDVCFLINVGYYIVYEDDNGDWVQYNTASSFDDATEIADATSVADGMAACAAEETCTFFTGYRYDDDDIMGWHWFAESGFASAIPEGWGTIFSLPTAEETTNTDDTYEWAGVVTDLTPASEEEEEEVTEETEAASYLTMGFAAASAVVASMF